MIRVMSQKGQNVLEHWTVNYGSLAHWPLKAPTDPFTVGEAAAGSVGLCCPKRLHGVAPSALGRPRSGLGSSLQEPESTPASRQAGHRAPRLFGS